MRGQLEISAVILAVSIAWLLAMVCSLSRKTGDRGIMWVAGAGSTIIGIMCVFLVLLAVRAIIL